MFFRKQPSNSVVYRLGFTAVIVASLSLMFAIGTSASERSLVERVQAFLGFQQTVAIPVELR